MSSPPSIDNGIIWEVEVFKLVAFKMEKEFHLHNLNEVKFHHLVANFGYPMLQLDFLNAMNKMISSIWACKA